MAAVSERVAWAQAGFVRATPFDDDHQTQLKKPESVTYIQLRVALFHKKTTY